MRFPLWMVTALYILGMEKELGAALESNDFEKVNEIKRRLEVTADREIVTMEQKHIVERQFAEGYDFMKELIANAMDSYVNSTERKPFIIDIEDGEYDIGIPMVSVEDFGKGLSANDLLSYLLVVGSTDKRFDERQIGTHGMGFFSTLRYADKIIVEAQNLDLTIFKGQSDEYEIDFSPRENPRKGTKVSVIGRRLGQIYQSHKLDEICGFVDPKKYAIYLNLEKQIKSRKDSMNKYGVIPDLEQINSRKDLMRTVRKKIKMGDERYDVDFHMCFVYPRDRDLSGIVYTQNGLRIATEKNRKIKDFVFFIDLPPKARIPRSRNSVPEPLKTKLDKEVVRLNRRCMSSLPYLSLGSDQFMYLENSTDQFDSRVERFNSVIEDRIGEKALIPIYVGPIVGMMTLAMLYPPSIIPILLAGAGVSFVQGIRGGIKYARSDPMMQNKKIPIKDALYQSLYGLLFDTGPIKKFIPSIECREGNVIESKQGIVEEKITNLKTAIEYMDRGEIYFYPAGQKPLEFMKDGLYIDESYKHIIAGRFSQKKEKEAKKKLEEEEKKEEKERKRKEKEREREEKRRTKYKLRVNYFHKSGNRSSHSFDDFKEMMSGLKGIGRHVATALIAIPAIAAGAVAAVPYGAYKLGCFLKDEAKEIPPKIYMDRPLPNFMSSAHATLKGKWERKVLLDLSNYISTCISDATGRKYRPIKYFISRNVHADSIRESRLLNLSSNGVRDLLAEIKSGHLGDTSLYSLINYIGENEELAVLYNHLLKTNVSIRGYADNLLNEHAKEKRIRLTEKGREYLNKLKETDEK